LPGAGAGLSPPQPENIDKPTPNRHAINIFFIVFSLWNSIPVSLHPLGKFTTVDCSDASRQERAYPMHQVGAAPFGQQQFVHPLP